MKTLDRVILAAIALALTVIAMNPWVAPGYVTAQSRTMDVNIRDVSALASPLQVNIAKIGGVEVRLPRMEATPAIPVYVMNK